MVLINKNIVYFAYQVRAMFLIFEIIERVFIRRTRGIEINVYMSGIVQSVHAGIGSAWNIKIRAQDGLLFQRFQRFCQTWIYSFDMRLVSLLCNSANQI